MTATDQPRLLDLFCGAGGAGMGYHRAGFDVVGVDIAPQPRYPFTFIQGDALEYVRRHGREFEAVHASPPCQAYSRMRRIKRNRTRVHPELVQPMRDILSSLGVPWVIENVEGAPLYDPLRLCGLQFDLPLYRHRLFESSIPLRGKDHPKHEGVAAVHTSGSKMELIRSVMGTEWMSRDETSQAVPPTFTEYVGTQLLTA